MGRSRICGPAVRFFAVVLTIAAALFLASSVSSNVASAVGSSGYVVGRKVQMIFVGGPIISANIRAWICLSDQTAATMGASATPAGNWGCFRYDTSAGDTHWQCGASNAGTNGFTDTGITPDFVANHKFQITFNDSIPNVVCNLDGTDVATMTNGGSTIVPASGATIMRYMATLTTTLVPRHQNGSRCSWLGLDTVLWCPM